LTQAPVIFLLYYKIFFIIGPLNALKRRWEQQQQQHQHHTNIRMNGLETRRVSSPPGMFLRLYFFNYINGLYVGQSTEARDKNMTIS
jgi:hypothetical protein